MRRLSRAGFKPEFVRPAILPDWWDDDCADDSALLPEIEIRVARFLERSVSEVRDAGRELTARVYDGAHLRRVRDIDRGRLGPAIHSAIQVAAAVVRSLRGSNRPVQPLPIDALVWRNDLLRSENVVRLDDLVANLWERGIPVVPLEVLPTPSFQGLACVVEGRPVVLLGHKHDEPGRAAFIVAHEGGHIAAGDCTPNQPVVDEDEEISDDSEIERRADRFATRFLVGSDQVPEIRGGDFRQLARTAVAQEKQTGADASAIIYSWARQTGDYPRATMAVKALYRANGARRTLRQWFDRYVDLDTAAESDRQLLRCVYGDPETDATAG